MNLDHIRHGRRAPTVAAHVLSTQIIGLLIVNRDLHAAFQPLVDGPLRHCPRLGVSMGATEVDDSRAARTGVLGNLRKINISAPEARAV